MITIPVDHFVLLILSMIALGLTTIQAVVLGMNTRRSMWAGVAMILYGITNLIVAMPIALTQGVKSMLVTACILAVYMFVGLLLHRYTMKIS